MRPNAQTVSYTKHLALNPGFPGILFEPWQLLTYNFLHLSSGLGGFLHILFNMLWLVWVGRDYEELYGPHRLLSAYVLGGLGGGLLTVLLHAALPSAGLFSGTVHGASASVLGVLTTVAVLNPEKSIALIFIGTVRLIWVVVAFLVLDLLFIAGSSTSISAHLGGAFAGFLLARAEGSGTDLSSWARVFFRDRQSRSASRTSSPRAAEVDPDAGFLARLEHWLARRGGGKKPPKRKPSGKAKITRSASHALLRRRGRGSRRKRPGERSGPHPRQDQRRRLRRAHRGREANPLRSQPPLAAIERPLKRRRSGRARRRRSTTALLLLDALLLVAFGLGFAAAYLHPRHLWWTELIAVGLPYLAILVGLGAVWAAAQRRWRLLAVHSVLLVLALFRFAPLGRLAASPKPAPDDLTLLTFNLVRHWEAQEGRQARVMDYFRAVHPDLIALQEAYVVYSPRSPRGRPAPHLTLVIDSLGYHPARLEGLSERLTIQDPVLARMALGEQTVTPLPKPRGDTHPPRLVGVQFHWQGREAVLYNIHLRSFGPGKPWQEANRRLLDPRLWKTYYDRYHEAYLLRAVEVEAIVRVLKEETRPYLLCGDFNSTPHNWAYRHLVRELGLQDAFEVAGKGWGSTYHSRLPFARIDYVLASPDWEIVSARVGDVQLSDHRPLLGRLRWAADDE